MPNKVISPYRPDSEAKIGERVRDVRVQTDQLRWMINQHCPEGEVKDRLHRELTMVEAGAVDLIKTRKE